MAPEEGVLLPPQPEEIYIGMPELQSSSPSSASGNGTDDDEEPTDISGDSDVSKDGEGEIGDVAMVEFFINDVEADADPSAIPERERAGRTSAERAGQPERGGPGKDEDGRFPRERVGRALASSYF